MKRPRISSKKLRRFYQWSLRRLMPVVGTIRYADVVTPYDVRWGDGAIGLPTADIPDYEEALILGLRAHVRSGDRVVIVGGGIGITAVVAARATGSSGRVTCYEGSRDQIALIEQVLDRNGCRDQVDVVHATVGSAKFVYGSSEGARAVQVKDLPECDVLELDCEGAERDILEGLSRRPRILLVETHGCFGSPTADTRRRAESHQYLVEDMGVAEPRLNDKCVAGDIHVLVCSQMPL